MYTFAIGTEAPNSVTLSQCLVECDGFNQADVLLQSHQSESLQEGLKGQIVWGSLGITGLGQVPQLQ